jgi:hypothetical protein
MFKRSAPEIRYRFQGNQSSLADYLSRNPVTGLVIARTTEFSLSSINMIEPTATGLLPSRWLSRSPDC